MPDLRFPPLRHRQVHLDFHTSEAIPGIGREFAADEFIATLKAGAVNSVTMFAMCHHGWCYYPTQVGKPHPHLETDLLGRMLAACQAADIEAPVYITVGWNEQAGREHPEWLVLDREGRLPNVLGPVNERPLTPAELAALPPDTPKPWGWRRLCTNTGYLDYLLAVTREVMERYRPVGIFYDITGEEPCFCPKCRADMAARGIGLDDAQAVTAFAQEVYKTYLRRTSELIWGINPATRLYHNSTDRKGRDDLYKYFSHYEIESLPTSFWGYEHFPPNAAYFPVKGMDCLGMTGKFHLMWGEFGGYKNPEALRYECARMLAYGTKCSVGDQMPPSGRLDAETYRIIGAAYRHVAEREAWSGGAAVADVGVLCPTAVTGIKDEPGNQAEMGVASVLGEGHHLYAMLDAAMDFAPYKALILPDCVPVGAALRAKLEAYLAGGGKLLLSGTSGLDPAGQAFQVDTGAEMVGASPWDVDFTLAGPKLAKGLVASPFLNYLPGRQTRVTTGKALATAVAPYFNRTFGHFCSHGVTPPSGADAGYPAAVRNRAGNVVYLANPVFGQYCRKGMQLHRDFALNALALLLPKRTVETKGLPSGGLVTLQRRTAAKDCILHLLYGVPVKRGETRVIEDLPAIPRIKVTLRLPEAVAAVRLVPEGRELAFRPGRDGKVTFTLPRLEMHQMIQVTFR